MHVGSESQVGYLVLVTELTFGNEAESQLGRSADIQKHSAQVLALSDHLTNGVM